MVSQLSPLQPRSLYAKANNGVHLLLCQPQQVVLGAKPRVTYMFKWPSVDIEHHIKCNFRKHQEQMTYVLYQLERFLCSQECQAEYLRATTNHDCSPVWMSRQHGHYLVPIQWIEHRVLEWKVQIICQNKNSLLTLSISTLLHRRYL